MQIKEIEELIGHHKKMRDLASLSTRNNPEEELHDKTAAALTFLLEQTQWREIKSADKSQEILALSKSWEDGKRPILLRWFKYNGTEAWRDWDHDPHFPTHYLPLPLLPEEENV